MFYPAEGKTKSIIQRIADETGVPYANIERVMWCESEYNTTAIHINKSGSIDRGLMQINDIHAPEYTSLNLDMFNPDDNATYAIILINREGLTPWVCKP